MKYVFLCLLSTIQRRNHFITLKNRGKETHRKEITLNDHKYNYVIFHFSKKEAHIRKEWVKIHWDFFLFTFAQPLKPKRSEL